MKNNMTDTEITEDEKYALANLEERFHQFFGEVSNLTQKPLAEADRRLNLISACERVAKTLREDKN